MILKRDKDTENFERKMDPSNTRQYWTAEFPGFTLDVKENPDGRYGWCATQGGHIVAQAQGFDSRDSAYASGLLTIQKWRQGDVAAIEKDLEEMALNSRA